MNTHDIELPKPFMTVYDDVDKVEVGCYSEIQVRAAIEADRKRGGEPVAWSANTNVNPRPTYQRPPPPPPPPPFQPMAREYVERFGGLVRKDSAPHPAEPVNGEELLAAREALIDMGCLWDGDQWVEVDPPSKTAEQAPEWPDFAHMEASLQRLKERLVFENSRRNDLEQKLREKRNG